MRRHQLRAFFLLTFAISWGIPGLALLSARWTGITVSLEEYSFLSYVAIWAPALSAFIVVVRTRGWIGLRYYLRRLLQWNVQWGWYAALLIGIPLLNLAAAAGMEVLGRKALVMPSGSIGAMLSVALLRATEGPVEELGWRGFALPMLQRNFSGLQASIILGFIWALWHVPAFLIGRSVGGGLSGNLTYVLVVFFLITIATSILMTVVYNGTGGSIPMAFLFHWMTNWPYPWETGVDLSLIAGPLWVVVAAVVVILERNRYLGHHAVHTRVTS